MWRSPASKYRATCIVTMDSVSYVRAVQSPGFASGRLVLRPAGAPRLLPGASQRLPPISEQQYRGLPLFDPFWLASACPRNSKFIDCSKPLPVKQTQQHVFKWASASVSAVQIDRLNCRNYREHFRPAGLRFLSGRRCRKSSQTCSLPAVRSDIGRPANIRVQTID